MTAERTSNSPRPAETYRAARREKMKAGKRGERLTGKIKARAKRRAEKA